jgi:CRP-like cAMP-binding protein
MPPHEGASAPPHVDPTPTAASLDAARQLHAFTGPLDEETIAALASTLQHVTLPAGGELFRQGEPGDAVFFVASGRLAALVTRDDGQQVRIGEVGAGESVGEMALLSGQPRMASVQALEDSRLLRLSKAGYDTLVARAPHTLAVFARVMAERLARSARARQALSAIRSTSTVTLQECAAAVATPDPVMLNLTITQLYHRIALDLTVLLGAQDVNWFGFACRASTTAGSAIRGEDVPILRPTARFVARRLPDALVSRLQAWRIVRHADAALAAVTTRIAEGNRLIFSEIGPVFVRLVSLCADHHAHDPARIEALVATLTPGRAEDGGQDLLRDAARAYYDAAFEPHPKKRAELILLGSLKIGLHEQIRVDPLIDEALDRPMLELVAVVAPWLSRLPRGWRIEERVRHSACRRARRLVTARLMRIRLPYGDLRLGDDLPELPARRRFPDLLASLELPELAATFARFDRGLPTRAIDWSDLDDRMRYIANFFRSRQKSLEIFEPPFLFAQQAEILGGRVPQGPL